MKHEDAIQLLEKVKDDYQSIALVFSQTRNRPWPEFAVFEHYITSHDVIVDVGCGNGRLRNSLPFSVSYIGVDNASHLLREAQKLHPEDVFREGDLLDIPVSDKAADVTLCIAALHHIPSPAFRRNALAELHRITKPGGYVIVTVWNLWQKKYLKAISSSFFRSLVSRKYEWNDLFIPWKKGDTYVHRYYHAFRYREFQNLLSPFFEVCEMKCMPYNFLAVCKKSE